MIKNHVEIYGTGRTVIVLDDDVKIRIMHYLDLGERGFDDIVKFTKKAKSTVSQHLAKLEQDGLITSIKDPLDRRKTIYRSCAKLLFIKAESKPILNKKTLDDISKLSDGAFIFMNAIFRALRYITDSFGADARPMLRLMGEQIGKELSKRFRAEDIDGLVEEISEFWKKNQLGEIEVIEKNPLTFIVKNCYECSNMPDIGRTLCVFDEGLLKSIFDTRLHKKSTVREVECSGTGYEHCKFIVLTV